MMIFEFLIFNGIEFHSFAPDTERTFFPTGCCLINEGIPCSELFELHSVFLLPSMHVYHHYKLKEDRTAVNNFSFFIIDFT